MQQLHQGAGASFQGQTHQQGGWVGNGWNGQDQNAVMSSAPHPGYNGGYPTNASAVDDLVSGAAREADDIDEIIRMAEAGIKPPKKGDVQAVVPTPPAPTPAAEPTPTPVPESAEKVEAGEKKSKKDKPIRMIYSDTELSPEERMAKMPRYAFVPQEKTETALVDVNAQPGVAGTVDE